MRADPSYSSLRRRHLVLALKSLSQRQQTAIVLLAAILGPAAVGFMQGIASGIGVMTAPGTPPWTRCLAFSAWVVVTSLVVLALREPVFMLAARPFLRMLPIRRRYHFACDARSIAIAYSFLWMPVGLHLAATWTSSAGLTTKLDATFIVAVAMVVGITLQALAVHVRAAAIALALFAALAFCMAPSVQWPGNWFVLLSATALCGIALIIGYEHPAVRTGPRARAPAIASRIAAWSGLAVPVAWRDLRHALGLRMALVLAALAAGGWLAQEGSFCGRATGFYIVQSALVTLALYRSPAVIDERLVESLPWIFRLRAARIRAGCAAAIMTAAAFVPAAWAAAMTWEASCGTAMSPVIPWTFGGALAALAAFSFRWKAASTWVALAATLVICFTLGEAL